MSSNKYDALQTYFDFSRIQVNVYCDRIGDLPEGKRLVHNRDTGTHEVDGEPWCTEVYLAHHDDAQNWRVEKVAREMQHYGWSFKNGSWRCPHCTKRSD